jgi:ATP-binding cassette subfamily G (WHITE) protein 2 (SNQ2)
MVYRAQSAALSSTRGLDASTALEFVRALRIATDMTRITTIVSLCQAGESLYGLFDKVAVIYEGRMAYFGPAREAFDYFVEMGYKPAHRQTTADFLVAVTDPNARISHTGVTSIPRTAMEFAEYFKTSWIRKQNLEDIASYRNKYVGRTERISAYQDRARAERAPLVPKGSPYTISIFMQAEAVMTRRLQILKGNYAALIATIMSMMHPSANYP